MPNTDTNIGRLPFAILVLVIAISPWPLGSNRDWAWPVLSVLIGMASLALIYTQTDRFSNNLKLSLWSFFFLILWMLIQLFGIPALLDPITVDAFATKKEILKTITLACVFFTVAGLVRTDKLAQLLIYAIILVALLESLLGGIQQLVFDLGRSQGSFPNPNHFAGYLEMAISLAIGLMIAHQGQATIDRRLSVSEILTGPLARLRLIIVIMVIALVMSRSRSGNVAFFSSVLISSSIAFYYSRNLSRSTIMLLISILAIDAIIIGNYFGLERLGERFTQTSQHLTERIDLQKYNLEIIKEHPLAGLGAGSFETGFTPYRDELIRAKPTHAENDFLELLIELGIIGCIPLAIILGAGLQAQIQLLGSKTSPFGRGIALGCLTGTIAILIHGFTDVNLQIPSNSILFLVLLALPMALNRSR
jgi:O-antigen ligase